MEKIKIIFAKKIKLIIFLIVFVLICIIYNQNNQTLNYFLKRGVILEYSVKNVNVEKLENKIADLGVKYSSCKQEDDIFYLALPVKIDNQKELINNISSYIFEIYPNSKLNDIKTLNNNYHKPYNSFLKFLGVFSVSLFVWIILLYLILDDKNFVKKAKEALVFWFENKKEEFFEFIKKTKERGFVYFLKKILFDEVKDENGNEKEIDFTREIISTILFVIVCVIVIRFFIGELRWIPSGSMRYTILEKDRVFVEKLDFPKKEIKRGDILVFYPPEVQLRNDIFSIFSRLSGIMCKDMAFIKRVVGMPNDKFEVKYNGKLDEYKVYINDEPLEEPYIASKTDWTPCQDNMFCGPFIIPEGHYFMMGDNRGNSQDSRFWGTLPKERIIGRANFMFWPISRINVMTDKYIELYSKKQNGEFINKNYILNRY
ncbi:MAG: signal peptidase I [Candidatus Gastranaerophilales bacterium]|nr:signal peptidase I [Candidatus Gastranaerophilales bacterium]